MHQLENCDSNKKILLGKESTKGLGAGGDPHKGVEAVKESMAEIKDEWMTQLFRSFVKSAIRYKAGE